MKNLILKFVFVLSLACFSFAGYSAFIGNPPKLCQPGYYFSTGDSTWQDLGGSSFFVWGAEYQSLALSPDGTPYVAYRDLATENKTSVLKRNGFNRNPLGGFGISDGDSTYQSLAIGKDGSIYAAYRGSMSEFYKTKVLSWNGNYWRDLSCGGLSESASLYVDLEVGPNNGLYVAYSDNGFQQKTVVQKYDSNGWQILGYGGISSGAASYQSLAVGPDGMPYIAYRDHINSYKSVVLKRNGDSRQSLGGLGISPGSAINQSLAVDFSGNVYLAYRDIANGGKTTVMNRDGTSWTAMGGLRISSGRSTDQKLTLSPDGVLYVSYVDSENGNKAKVLKWNGSARENVGGAFASNTSSSFLSLSTDKYGTPYLAYQESNNAKKLTVLKYSQDVCLPNIDVKFNEQNFVSQHVTIGAQDVLFGIFDISSNIDSQALVESISVGRIGTFTNSDISDLKILSESGDLICSFYDESASVKTCNLSLNLQAYQTQTIKIVGNINSDAVVGNTVGFKIQNIKAEGIVYNPNLQTSLVRIRDLIERDCDYNTLPENTFALNYTLLQIWNGFVYSPENIYQYGTGENGCFYDCVEGYFRNGTVCEYVGTGGKDIGIQGVEIPKEIFVNKDYNLAVVVGNYGTEQIIMPSHYLSIPSKNTFLKKTAGTCYGLKSLSPGNQCEYVFTLYSSSVGTVSLDFVLESDDMNIENNSVVLNYNVLNSITYQQDLRK